jgi:hypothetical protein
VQPLRERREDIPLLTWTFVKEFANSMGKAIDAVDAGSMAALLAYHGPATSVSHALPWRHYVDTFMRAFLLATSADQRARLMLPTGLLSAVECPVTSKYISSLSLGESCEFGNRTSLATL